MDALAWAQVLSALVTAAATIALWYVTRVLAVEIRRMAAAAAQPHVVATVEPNQWSLNHFDRHVANTGNATAYNVTVSFDPPLDTKDVSVGREMPMPFQNISVIRPSQTFMSYVGDYENIKQKSFTVTITWRLTPNGPVEQNIYSLKMSDYEGFNTLGNRFPLVDIAQDMKKIREALQRERR